MDRLNPNRRCSRCGQYVIADRETPLEDQRFEWDESLVDDLIAGNSNFCVDTDPRGARESERLIEAGLLRPELGWLIAEELECRQAQAATIPAYRLLPAPRTTVASSSTTVIIVVVGARIAAACCWPSGGPPGPRSGSGAQSRARRSRRPLPRLWYAPAVH
jgi:hypothetical protein